MKIINKAVDSETIAAVRAIVELGIIINDTDVNFIKWAKSWLSGTDTTANGIIDAGNISNAAIDLAKNSASIPPLASFVFNILSAARELESSRMHIVVMRHVARALRAASIYLAEELQEYSHIF